MNPSVILIDDCSDLIEVFSEFLALRSIDVLATGSNGKEAVELYQRYSPDAVIMDYSMPNYDGLYGLENILKINPDAKIIMFTGSADSGLFDKFKESGASLIVEKPGDFDSVVKMISMISNQHHSAKTDVITMKINSD